MGTGCVWDFGNTRVEADVQVNEQAIDVTLDRAAEKLQQELQRRGLEVTVNSGGDTVRVVSKTRSGDQFTVVLNRTRTSSGKEQTQVRVEWGPRPDRELWLELLVALGPAVVQAAR
jgi:hypothetical protein